MKHLKKQQENLKRRITGYESMKKGSKAGGKEYTKPGSMNSRAR